MIFILKQKINVFLFIILIISVFSVVGCTKEEIKPNNISHFNESKSDTLKSESSDLGDKLYEMVFTKGKIIVVLNDNIVHIVDEESKNDIYSFSGGKNDVYVEEFKNDMNVVGYKLYEGNRDPYGGEVYYLVENQGEICVMLENHCKYQEGKYSDSFNFEVDTDKDGTNELISTVYYVGDGGVRTNIYRKKNDKIQKGDLVDLLKIDGSKLDSRATSLKSEYDKKNNKAIIQYTLKSGTTKKTTKQIKQDKIKFENLDMKSIEEYFKQ